MHKKKSYEDMNNKPHILIFGANSTIAQALIKQISPDFSLSLAARNTEKLEDPTASTIDLDDPESFDNAFSQAIAQRGSLHAVINCIGSILLKPAHLIRDKEWIDTLTINLTSCFYITRAAGKHLFTTGGSVVFISSAASLIGLPNHEAIAAAKAGIHGLMLSAATTYAPHNLRFNCVAPGLVSTVLTEQIIHNPKAFDISLKLHPLGRAGQPEDIANIIAFLIDPKNAWITGQIFTIDGGLSHLKTWETL
jgi:3-oxoacyl-[acyl-carrier protein] reductase